MPPRSRRTFVELLIGCMFYPEGWVTLALVVRVRLGSALTAPIRSWLLGESGQRGRLWVARQLMDSVRGHVVRWVLAVARFLKGLPVHAAWCETFLSDHVWSRPRLILATATDLSAQQVVEIYAEHEGVEPLFHSLKRWWGVANRWQ